MFIPHDALAPETLRAVIESFVLREGTDYGERELSLEAKRARVHRQLERGEARIVFDPDSQSIDIVQAASRERTP
ncbi:MAG TPA: YheU family protein [Steroidobacteraceae bacterium]